MGSMEEEKSGSDPFAPHEGEEASGEGEAVYFKKIAEA
jgi:hypothetical protein